MEKGTRKSRKNTKKARNTGIPEFTGNPCPFMEETGNRKVHLRLHLRNYFKQCK